MNDKEIHIYYPSGYQESSREPIGSPSRSIPVSEKYEPILVDQSIQMHFYIPNTLTPSIIDTQFGGASLPEETSPSGFDQSSKVPPAFTSSSEGNATVNVMNRPINESMAKTLKRFHITLSKRFLKNASKSEKKGSKKESKAKESISLSSKDETFISPTASSKSLETSDSTATSDILIYSKDKVIDINSLSNREWDSGMIVECNIQDIKLRFKVVVDPPCITSINTFPKRVILSNSFICPTISTINADDALTKFFWYKSRENPKNPSEYELLSSDKIYKTTETDIGYPLTLVCIPYRSSVSSDGNMSYSSGRMVSYHLPGIVQPAPELGILPSRKDILESYDITTDDEAIRMVTYNILADQYASTVYAVNVLYSYLDSPLYLDIEYRCQLIVSELFLYQADIIGLQECDEKTYSQYFQPIFQYEGYASNYFNKVGSVREGCGMFISKKLTIECFIQIPIKSYLKQTSEFQNLYNARPDIYELISSKLGTINQICLCKHKSRYLLIANTHLFFHPLAGYVRLLQIHAILRSLRDIKEYVQVNGFNELESFVTRFGTYVRSSYCSDEAIEQNIGVILMGDLNSTFWTAAKEFIESGIIDTGHEIWDTTTQYKWSQGEDDESPSTESSSDINNIDNIDDAAWKESIPILRHPFQFMSAAGYPKYTNYTRGFRDILDYIYIDKELLTPVRVASFPDETELSRYVAIPCRGFPSDHLPILVDITWR